MTDFILSYPDGHMVKGVKTRSLNLC